MSPSVLTTDIRPTQFFITSINVNLLESSRRHVEYVELRVGSRTLAVRHVSIPSKSFSETFTPGIEVSDYEQCSVSVHCCHRQRVIGIQMKTVVDLVFASQDIALSLNAVNGKRTLRLAEGKLQVVVSASETLYRPEPGKLVPVSDSILHACPRFRLLVMGKDGVGKSSLIARAFKIRSLRFYEACQRQDGIDTELIFQENDKVVLHNSRNLVPGTDNSVEGFLTRRQSMPELKDRVHAVWLCVGIPRANEPLFDEDTKRFIERRKQILGDTPLVIVFTKLDLLVGKIEYESFSDQEDPEPWDLEEYLRNELEKACIQPLQELAGTDIPNVAISVQEGYESTIEQLLEVTAGKVDRYVANEAAVAALMAQRASISLKLSNSISVGKKRHWRGLASGSKFLGYVLKDCLDVIHTEIVSCWNFEDPNRYLISDQFKTLMLNMVANTDTRDLPDAEEEEVGFGVSVASAIIGIRGTAVRVVLPIAANIMLVGWAYDLYQYSGTVLSQCIAYIVDLTAIMQILFLLTPHGQMTIPAIKLAITAYSMAGINEVHSRIKDHYENPHNVLTLGNRDQALDMIVRLIKETSIKSEELVSLRARLGDLGKLQRDDPRYGWDDDDE